MDNRLKSANYFAIPLEINETSVLYPQPNWLIIDNIFGKITADLPTLGNVICAQSAYKLTFREILQSNAELGRSEEMREIIYEHTNQPIPINVVPYFSSYESLLANLTEVNALLNLFQFRGVLADFKLKVDEVLLNEILTDAQPVIVNGIPPVEIVEEVQPIV